MKFFTYLVLLTVLLIRDSLEQRSSTTPSTRSITSGQRNSTEARSRQPQNADSEKGCKQSEKKEKVVHESFTKLMIVGDRHFLMSHNHEDQKQHCDHAKKNLKIFVDHVKCTVGTLREKLLILVNSLTKWVDRRCTSTAWHNSFMNISKCFSDADKQKQWHICNDREVVMFSYILKNIAAKDQMDAVCCGVQFAQNCQHNNTANVCGRKVADMAYDAVWEPWYDILHDCCADKYNCEANPNLVDIFHKIWKTKPKGVKTGAYYKKLFKILQNSFA